MLQNIRKNTQGVAAKILIGAIVLSFAAFGIESLLPGGGGGSVAEVNGEEVTPQELQDSLNTIKRRLIQALGQNLDPAMLADERLRPQALESLISRKLQLQAADELGLAVSERQIGSVIGDMEQFKVEGKFAPDVYKSVLSSAGYTPASFKRNLKIDLVLNQLRSGLASSEFVTPRELELAARITDEQRDLRYLSIPMQHSSEFPEPDRQQVEAYYRDNQSEFLSEEAVDLDYIELQASDFFEPVAEADLKEAYRLELESPIYQNEQRVAHILFEQRSGESDADLAARVSAAQARLSAGEDFAAVAASHSDDVGSAAAGGDLGYSSGDAFPEEMENALSELALNQVSAPVETEAGIHLLMVSERRMGEPPPLAKLRGQLEERLQLAAARVELLRTVEELRDLAFNADGLKGPAADMKLEIKTSNSITRTQSGGVFANPSLLSQAFSDEVLLQGNNSEVVELGGDRFVVLRVRHHYAPETKSLDEVDADIIVRLRDQAAREAVVAAADAARKALREGATIEQFANANGYQWQVALAATRRDPAVPAEVLTRAFELSAPGEGQSYFDYVIGADGSAKVFELARVNIGNYASLSKENQAQLEQQINLEHGQLVDAEYRDSLRKQAEINVL